MGRFFHWLLRFLGTSKSTEESHLRRMFGEAKVSRCFARRIENNKSKKMKTKANEHECSDRVDWSSLSTRSLFGTNAFQTSSERVWNAFMMFACVWAALYVPTGSKYEEKWLCCAPTDTWGRLENASAVTASNVAKYDALHSMAVFKDHSPSAYSQVKMA